MSAAGPVILAAQPWAWWLAGGVLVTVPSEPSLTKPYFNRFHPDKEDANGNIIKASQDPGAFASLDDSNTIPATYNLSEITAGGGATGNIIINAAMPTAGDPRINLVAIADLIGTGHIDADTNGFISFVETTGDLRVGKIWSRDDDVTLTAVDGSIVDAPTGAGAAADSAAMSLAEVVCVGAPLDGLEVRVSGPGGELPDGEIGEVCARGPSIFAGYYNDPEATAETLEDGWLHTGDLGFVDGGELYVTGRIKDLLIVRGNNVMPHEIEWVAESVTGGGGALRSGAFSVARGAQGEEVVVVVEVDHRERERLGELGREIRQKIGRSLSLPVADLVFVRRGKIPKTTSGKVQRRELRDRYLRGEVVRL